MSDYLDNEQVAKIQANNQQIQSMANAIDRQEQERIERIGKKLKAVKQAVSPTHIMSEALKSATGRGPLSYIVHDGIGTQTKRRLTRSAWKNAGMRLTGGSGQNGMGEINPTQPPSPVMMIGGSLLVLAIVYCVYDSIFGRK